MSLLAAKRLEKHYGHHVVLENLNFSVEPGEFVTLVGASGCGKTTFLKMLLGTEATSRGSLTLDENKDRNMTQTILVIEDDTDILNLVAWHLQSEDYHALKCADGKEGLESAIHKKPDLIVLDLMLPGMAGVEICKSLNRNPDTAEIPAFRKMFKTGN
ncbi:MAG: response regulator [Halomonas sp.]